ncbi:MAG: hypothetical protein EON87_18510 [Brevundimonas sp.]|nr:MAG: hypothetical protein EON87_18510 [Brevundimonas sp.]
MGWAVMRFENPLVMGRLAEVLESVWAYARTIGR